MRSLRTSNHRLVTVAAAAAAAAVIAVTALVTTVQLAILLLSFATLLAATLAFLRSREALRRIDRLSDRSAHVGKRAAGLSEDLNRGVRRALRRARDADGSNAARLSWMSRRLDDSTASLMDGLSEVRASVADASKQMEERFAQLEDRVSSMSEHDPSDVQLRRRLVGDFAAALAPRTDWDARLLPVWSDWGLAPQGLLEVVNLVRGAHSAPLVIELGSGDSTLWIAKALADRGNGKLISFEHDETHGRSTRARLASAGLEDWVELRVAPLRRVEIDGESYPWYDDVGDLRQVSVVVVAGPPGHLGYLARLPAFPTLMHTLATGALVLLDEADRGDEQEIVTRWSRSSTDGRRLRVVRRVDRAVVLQLVSD